MSQQKMTQAWFALVRHVPKTKKPKVDRHVPKTKKPKVDWTNLKTVEAFRCANDCSLVGMGCNDSPLVDYLMTRIEDNPTAIMFVGDQGEEHKGLRTPDKDVDLNLFEFHCSRRTVVLSSPLHKYCAFNFKRGDEKIAIAYSSEYTKSYRYLINDQKKEYIIIRTECGDLPPEFHGMHPLPLLTASPFENGRGGCDWDTEYGYRDHKFVGRWAGHYISCGLNVPEGYQELNCFHKQVFDEDDFEYSILDESESEPDSFVDDSGSFNSFEFEREREEKEKEKRETEEKAKTEEAKAKRQETKTLGGKTTVTLRRSARLRLARI